MTGVDADAERDAMALLARTGGAGYVAELPGDKVLMFVASVALARMVHVHLARTRTDGPAGADRHDISVEANLAAFLSQASALLGDVRYRALLGSDGTRLEPGRRDLVLGLAGRGAA